MHHDRLSNIVAEYLAGHLEFDTAVAQLTHVYVEHGWGSYPVEAECQPEHRERMRGLAARDAACRGTGRGDARARVASWPGAQVVGFTGRAVESR
jgi:hypothetical protein